MKPNDNEMAVLGRGIRDLASLAPPARRRVLAYWCARVDSLPVIAAVGGGTEDDDEQELPMMPMLQGARRDGATEDNRNSDSAEGGAAAAGPAVKHS
jgi:hypothetical protein